MLKSCGTLFNNRRDSLKILYSELSKLNTQIIRGEVVLSLDDLKNNEDWAKKFLSQYINKSGPIYDQVIADKTGVYATRIRALATNIVAILRQQREVVTISSATITPRSHTT